LADTIIKPRLFKPDVFGGVYYPVYLTKSSTGRNHHFAELIGTAPGLTKTYGADPWVGLTLFANPLGLWTSHTIIEVPQAEGTG
jgi:hypothetical protein